MTTIGGVGPLYLTGGTVVSLKESVRTNPSIKLELNAQEMADLGVRTEPEPSGAPAQSKPEGIYGQVIVGGQVFATVFESGTALMEREITGLSSHGSGHGLADARLQEIAKAVGGEVRRTDFLAVEKVLQLMNWDAVRSRI